VNQLEAAGVPEVKVFAETGSRSVNVSIKQMYAVTPSRPD
jgi:hypothetical protein